MAAQPAVLGAHAPEVHGDRSLGQFHGPGSLPIGRCPIVPLGAWPRSWAAKAFRPRTGGSVLVELHDGSANRLPVGHGFHGAEYVLEFDDLAHHRPNALRPHHVDDLTVDL